MTSYKHLLVLGLLSFSISASAQEKRVDFVYFGAHDCGPCRNWKAFDLPKLKASPAFQRIRFHEVNKTARSPIPSAFWFPEEIKHLRDPIAEKLTGAGSPMFAILTDGVVVSAWRGANKPPEEVIEILENQLRTR